MVWGMGNKNDLKSPGFTVNTVLLMMGAPFMVFLPFWNSGFHGELLRAS
jgi:hypothetical protein